MHFSEMFLFVQVETNLRLFFSLINLCRQEFFSALPHQTFPSESLSSSAILHPLICLSIHLPRGEVFSFGSNVCQAPRYKKYFFFPRFHWDYSLA